MIFSKSSTLCGSVGIKVTNLINPLGKFSKRKNESADEPESLIKIFPDDDMELDNKKPVKANFAKQGTIYEELIKIELEKEAQRKKIDEEENQR